MLTANQTQACQSLLSAVGSALKKGEAIRKEMMALVTAEALVAFTTDAREFYKAKAKTPAEAAAAMQLTSTIASQVRKAKGWPKLRAAGAGRKATEKGEKEDTGEPDALKGIPAAVAYLVKHHRDAGISKAQLAKFLEPLVPIIRYAAEK